MADFIEEANQKLESARKRLKQGREMKAIKQSAPTLFEIVDGEISLEINRGYDDKAPLSYEAYLESHGAVRGIRRIRNLIDSKVVDEVAASKEVNAIQENLKQIEDDKKQQ